MMKRIYESPAMTVDTFASNDYIAACYKIFCYTPNNNASYNELYWDSNGNGTLDSSDKKIGGLPSSFHGCNRYHVGVVRDSEPTANGFVSKKNKQSPAPVFIWEEKLGGGTYDYHVMTPGGKGFVDITSAKHPNASA